MDGKAGLQQVNSQLEPLKDYISLHFSDAIPPGLKDRITDLSSVSPDDQHAALDVYAF